MLSFRSERARPLTGLATAVTGVLCLATAGSASASGSMGGGPASVSASGAAAAAPSTPTARPWSYQATAGQSRYSLTEAVAQAKRFDVIAGNRFSYRGMAGAMHRANGHLKLLAYVNGAYAQKNEGTAFPGSWYLRNAAGDKVRSVGWGNYLMDVSNPAWIQKVADRCLVSMRFGYDGCFIDMLGAASVMSSWTNGRPVNPKTGRHFTPLEWLDLTSALSRKVHALVGAENPVYLNGLGRGHRYFSKKAPSSQLLAGADGALAESWVLGAGRRLSRHPSEKQWRQDVDMLSDVSARGKAALVTVKTWGPGTAHQVRAWHVYSLATYLMAADGRAQYSFLASPKADPTAVDPLLQNLRIGNPVGKYHKLARGGYARDFSHGKVLVNPTKRPVRVRLGGLYTTTSGKSVNQLTLRRNGARIVTAN